MEQSSEDSGSTTNVLSCQNTCSLCQESFESRNQLFQHLRSSKLPGHGEDALGLKVDANGYDSYAQYKTRAHLEARSQLTNPDWEAYYGKQGQNLEDWVVAQQIFKTPLPFALRLQLAPFSSRDSDKTSSLARFQWWRDLQDQLCRGSLGGGGKPFFEPSGIIGRDIAQVSRLPLRHLSPSLQRKIADAQEFGLMHRQELCSMVPVLLLLSTIPKESSTPCNFLDLCCAPGSKTLFLLDWMHANDNCHSQGILVANDSNRQRLLTTQRRSRTQPRSCLLLNARDGRYFPSLRKRGGLKFKFSHVLADVPCSGDGTLRKAAAQEWNEWKVKSHLKLHKLQVSLLQRALELVQKGGHVVYSTCSLDPIENEAVVVSAIARMGGPSFYRIIPVPEYLHESSTQAFRPNPGRTTWAVPHPQFSASEPTMYSRPEEVPQKLRRRDIMASMFPPHVRTEEAWIKEQERVRQSSQSPTVSEECEAEEREKLYKNAKHFGDFLPASDIALFQEQLPNCCRILPQHLDSGGFFCALIERVRPSYVALCCPAFRDREQHSELVSTSPEDTKPFIICRPEDLHGRIIHPAPPTKALRTFLARLRQQTNSNVAVHFEGLSTFEVAQDWLKKQGAFLEDRSLVSVSMPSNMDNIDIEGGLSRPLVAKSTTKGDSGPHERDRVESKPYTSLFKPPNPELADEFCDFFGLKTSEVDAREAGVDKFPIEAMILISSSPTVDPATVSSCQDPNHVQREISEADVPSDGPKYPKRKFLQLALLSEAARSLYEGGAKFDPIEVGLCLCWIPVPGVYRNKKQSPVSHDETPLETSLSELRSIRSGRYGLMDEAAELLGCCATKRIVSLSAEGCRKLLQDGTLEVHCDNDCIAPNRALDKGYWDRLRLNKRCNDIFSLEPGGVIVACAHESEGGVIFLSCSLGTSSDPGIRTLVLLTDDRLSQAYLRLLD